MKLTFKDFDNFYNSNNKFRSTEQYYLPLDQDEQHKFGKFCNDKFELKFVLDPVFDESENYIKLGNRTILLQDIESFDKLKRIIESRL